MIWTQIDSSYVFANPTQAAIDELTKLTQDCDFQELKNLTPKP